MKTYYILELDNFNQPSGIIKEIKLSKKDYQKMKNDYIYIYESYFQALQRAID